MSWQYLLHMYMYIYIYIHIHIHTQYSRLGHVLSSNMCMYIYIYIHAYMFAVSCSSTKHLHVCTHPRWSFFKLGAHDVLQMTREAAWRIHAVIGMLTLLVGIVSWRSSWQLLCCGRLRLAKFRNHDHHACSTPFQWHCLWHYLDKAQVNNRTCWFV